MASNSSKVPANRFSRFGSLASLAGRVAGGMLAEGARQLAQGKVPAKTDMLLTPANVRRVADQLAHLRGAAMKVGQLLSMDAGDMLPPALADILSRLRASANPMPAKQLAKVLQDEWGPNWQQHFADFSFMPLAAASIGQVHQAYHDNGQRLAVKVQYPGIKQSIDSDVDNVATLLRISGIIPAEVDYHSLLAEAKLQLKAEADYLQEAAHLSEYRQLLGPSADFLLPESIAALNTSNILVMSYVDGVPIESLTTQSQAVRDRVMRLLFALLFRELFEFALVQTDPNFANYLYNTDTAQLVLLDFGACRHYSTQFSQGYRALFTAALVNNNDGMAQALSDIGFFSQHIVPEQKQAVLQLVAIACEPLMKDAVFDFGATDLALRLRDAGTALSTQQQYWHSPPADALFLHRKIGGLYLLAARLKARVNVRELLQPYLL
ncbi:AarF/ABC1/UbiB kinase family protein [Rheinheimera baltica]|uniref:AarF/ABC1/UbiB kinase family protein n=1 Tax=Rheinheimera baltica TaxID=67576 RepID=A0ABT9I4B6_9GAMM|nr:AarF/ABC1/UbiB kinase family protein [Rheinheimera baltica]MDP5138230.1 AarF/ABC1/UbiB kinase family protein [Rheinheimera baltica]MDP5149650.1 AarF/ABC1/UbiB kinase family protein [Rheinheimera baltica]